MLEKSRNFVVAKDKKPTIKTPDRWAKRQKIMMYFLNKHVQGKWISLYEHFDCDADAMTWARGELCETCDMVALYRHDDEDTCGIKHFVASYYR